MTSTENNAKSASTPRTGRFALLSNVLRAKGATTPKIGGRALIVNLNATTTSGRQAKQTVGNHKLLSAIILITSLSLLFAAPAMARTAQHSLLSTFGPEGPHSTSSFQDADAVAVDEGGGYVYVDESGTKIERFNLAGEKADFGGHGANINENELTGFKSGNGSGNKLAVDDCENSLTQPCSALLEDPSVGDLYVVNAERSRVEAFTQSGEPVVFSEGSGAGTNVLASCGECSAVAVGANGDIYVSGSTGEVYAPTGAPIGSFPVTGAQFLELEPFVNIGGTYTLTFEGETTMPIEFTRNACESCANHKGPDAEAAQAALEALPKIGAHNVEVSEEAGEGDVDHLSIVFKGAPAHTIVPALGCDPSGLTGKGTGCKVRDPRHKGALAVNSNGVIYTVGETAGDQGGDPHVIALTPSSLPPVTAATTYTEVAAPLNEFVPEPKAIAVEPVTNDLYVVGLTNFDEPGARPFILQFDEAGDVIGAPFALEGAGAGASGVAVDGASGDVYVSDGGQANIWGPPEFPKAHVEAEAVSEISATGAIVTANINPEGEPTTYRVEYAVSGEEGCFASESCAKTSEASAGEGEAVIPVEARLSGLRPGTDYVLRIVAAATVGAPVTFTTLLAAPPTSSSLPDGRIYEPVSLPASADGEVFPPYTEHEVKNDRQTYTGDSIRAAAGGEAVAYAGEVQAAAGGGAGDFGNGYGDTFLARRGAHGWEPVDITPTVENAYNVYGGFTPNLSQAFLTVVDPAQTQAALAGCLVLYSYADGEYRPQFTSVFEGGCQGSEAASGPNEILAGASADGSAVAFESEGALTPEAVAGHRNSTRESATSTNKYQGTLNLYASSGGRVQQVNVGAEGEAESTPDAMFGGPAAETVEKGSGAGLEVQGHSGAESAEGDLAGAVAGDGSRMFWSSLEPVKSGLGLTEKHGAKNRVKALYARVNPAKRQSPVSESGECTRPADACTVQLDASTLPGSVKEKAEKGGGGEFRGASGDGSRVLFMDCHRLTAGSTAVTTGAGCSHAEPTKSEEYNYVFTGDDLYEYDFDRPVGERLTDLTVDHNAGDTLGADVQGVLGSSVDGSYVYFVADGDLAAGAVSGQPDLYLWHEGATSFIATLAPGDEHDWRAGLAERTAEVSPDGGAVVFQSTRPLTGFDNNGPHCVPPIIQSGAAKHTAGACSEVYVYDAGSGGAGSLACASCSPVGAAPSEDAGYLPNWSESPTYQLRVLSASGGRVFFDSPEALVKPAIKGVEAVYEWERPGEGGCTEQAASPVTGGCTYLLSGVSDEPAVFLDTDETGNNVFFTTRAQLVPEDKNQLVDLYDARVDGGFPHPSTACEGTGCQGVPPAPPTFATPASVTFNGTGNFPPAPPPPPKKVTKKTVTCKKGFTKKHNKCIRTKHKKSSYDRRPGR